MFQSVTYETHVTVSMRTGFDREGLVALADEHSMKLLHIELDRGEVSSQLMLTFHGEARGGRGLDDQLRRAGDLEFPIHRLRGEITRVKVEVPANASPAPADDREAATRSPLLYFEHHVKLAIPVGTDLADLRALVERHGAHLSRNAFDRRDDIDHRFVTQRCYGVGNNTAEARYHELLAELGSTGFEMLKSEREYVVHDSNTALDRGWIDPPDTRRYREAVAAQTGYAAGFTVVPDEPDVDYPKVFEPSLSHLDHGFRKGEPTFADEWSARSWLDARQRIFDTILAAISTGPLRDALVLRGSMLLHHWLGDDSRRPGDIDFVVRPPSLSIADPEAEAIVESLIALANTHRVIDDDVELDVDRVVTDGIWTDDRVPGRRITIPWSSGDLPSGAVQIDLVFNEQLWSPPIEVSFDGFGPDDHLLAAGPEQSLAWKLMWLLTDVFAQGKDLYDAVLLAERYGIDRELLARAWTAGGLTPPWQRHTDSPLAIDDWLAFPVDWDNFTLEYGWVSGDEHEWRRRLHDALLPVISGS
ncbi:MAG: nucleotidyl transferase AbiEii/AbiGii toxin family protein [Actinomycetota bacterium]